MAELPNFRLMASKTLHHDEHSFVWGVDLSTKSISMGWVTIDGVRRGVKSYDLAKKATGARRLYESRPLIIAATHDLAAIAPPIAVGVEQPFGRFKKPTLQHMAAVIQLSIYEALLELYGKPALIYDINGTDWKGMVKDDGFARVANFGKPDPKKGEDPADYPALLWAQANGYEGVDDNEADAICITEKIRRGYTALD
jgi:hypothetical protein